MRSDVLPLGTGPSREAAATIGAQSSRHHLRSTCHTTRSAVPRSALVFGLAAAVFGGFVTRGDVDDVVVIGRLFFLDRHVFDRALVGIAGFGQVPAAFLGVGDDDVGRFSGSYS